MKLERGPAYSWWFDGRCICGCKIRFNDHVSIPVNCHSEGRVEIPGMLGIATPCQNPLCEWSMVEELE